MALLHHGDEQEAERHLRCAAGGGSAEAAFRLAGVLDSRQPPPGPPGLGEPMPEKTECEDWYERAAEQGHRRAQVRVGMLAAARGDLESAARWYREAAESGSRNGAFNLGLLLAREGSEREAALWWSRAAERRPRPGRAAAGAARRPPRRAHRGAALVRAVRSSWARRRSRSGPPGCVRPCTRS